MKRLLIGKSRYDYTSGFKKEIDEGTLNIIESNNLKEQWNNDPLLDALLELVGRIDWQLENEKIDRAAADDLTDIVYAILQHVYPDVMESIMNDVEVIKNGSIPKEG